MTKPARIMIVEDEALLVKSISRLLELSGHKVVCSTAYGEDALDKAAQEQPDLILVDIKLAGELDGIETASRIRSSLDTAVVYLTASSSPDLFERARHTEPHGYLSKPVSPMDLERIIETALHKHRMEKVVRESERKFRLLYEQAPLAYFSFDADGRIMEVNRSWTGLLGYSRKEAVGRCWREFLAPGQGDHVDRCIRDFQESGEVQGVELDALTKGGSRLTISLDCKIGLDEEGRFAQAHCILHDVTEKRKAEQALREEREKFEVVARYVPLGLALIEADDTFLYVNPRFTEMFGYEPHEIADGKQWFRKAYPDPEIRRKAFSSWISYLETAESAKERPRVFTVTCKNGDRKTVQFRPVLLEGRRHLMTCEDITERTRYEEALRERERYARMLFDGIPSPALVLDRDLRRVDANSAARTCFGSNGDPVGGGLCGEVLHCVNDRESTGGCGTAEACKECAIRNSIKEASAGGEVFRRNHTMRLIEGETVRESVFRITTSKLEQGGRELFLVILEDVTEATECRRILPICPGCKQIRNDEPYRKSVESYFSRFGEILDHPGLCPDCLSKFTRQVHADR